MQSSIFRQQWMAAILFVLGIIGQPAWAISVKPALLDVRVDPGEHDTGMFTVANTSDAEERYRAEPQHFRLSRDGELMQVPPDSFSAAPWIKFNPREFTLAPRAEQQVRYTLVVPEDAEPGDRWCVLEFRDLNARTVSATGASEGRGVNVSVSSAIVVPIFVQVGNVSYEWSLLDMGSAADERGPRLVVTLSNTANGRVPFRTEVDVVNEQGDIVATQSGVALSLFPFSERVLQVEIQQPLEPGAYTARVRIASERDERVEAGETSLLVPAKP